MIAYEDAEQIRPGLQVMFHQNSWSASDYPTIVLKAARNCETIRVAVRCLGIVEAMAFHDPEVKRTVYFQAKARIAGEIQVVATAVRQAVEMQPGPEQNPEERTQRLREMACLDQLLAAQEMLNQELAQLLGGSARGPGD